jgi:DNA-binding NarL/FixJ family response regulator
MSGLLRDPRSPVTVESVVATKGGAGQTGDSRPYIVVVDDKATDLDLLGRRYHGPVRGAYQVLAGCSAADMLPDLLTMDGDRDRVAVVLAGQWMAEMTGSELLASLRSRHPRAKRVLLISALDWATNGQPTPLVRRLPVAGWTTTSPNRQRSRTSPCIGP